MYFSYDGNLAEVCRLVVCMEGNCDIVHALLEKNADVDAQDNDGATALMLAIINEHLEVIMALLSKNSNLNIRDYEGSTALMNACKDGSINCVRLLLDKGADAK